MLKTNQKQNSLTCDYTRVRRSYMNSNRFYQAQEGGRMLEKIKIFKVAIYIRLSKEDMDRGDNDSESFSMLLLLITIY